MLLRTMRKTERRVVEHVPAMSSLESAEKGLYEKISERYASAHAAFRAFADCGGSELSIDNVKSMIDRLVCVRIDRNDLNVLVRKMGSGGPIRYHAFREYVNTLECKFGGQSRQSGGNNAEQTTPATRHHRHPSTDRECLSYNVHDINKVKDLICEKLKQKYRTPSQAFLKFDHDRDGFISIQEFRLVLEQCGIRLSDENFRAISRRYDRDENNRISYHEFVRQMSTPCESDKQRRRVEEEVQSLECTKAQQKSLEYRLELERMIEAKKQRKHAEKERIRRLEEKEEREAANYNPWGRGGCGAPLRDNAGNVLANFQTRGKASTTTTVVEAVPQRVHTQYQHQEQQSYSRNNDSSPLSKHARFRFEDLPSYEQQAIKSKNQKQLQWQRDLAEQVERKRRLKEQEAARKREEDRKERIRLERQRIELQNEHDVRIRQEEMKKKEENGEKENKFTHLHQHSPSPRRFEEEYDSTPAMEQYQETSFPSSSRGNDMQQGSRRVEPSAAVSSIQHDSSDGVFLAKLEQRHEDALERQERAFSTASPQRRTIPSVDYSQDNQITSTSSIVYMTTNDSSTMSLSPSFQSRNKSSSDILMDFVKRRNFWGH